MDKLGIVWKVEIQLKYFSTCTTNHDVDDIWFSHDLKVHWFNSLPLMDLHINSIQD